MKTAKRRRTNTILKLRDEEGNIADQQYNISKMLKTNYKKMFQENTTKEPTLPESYGQTKDK